MVSHYMGNLGCSRSLKHFQPMEFWIGITILGAITLIEERVHAKMSFHAKLACFGIPRRQVIRSLG